MEVHPGAGLVNGSGIKTLSSMTRFHTLRVMSWDEFCLRLSLACSVRSINTSLNRVEPRITSPLREAELFLFCPIPSNKLIRET